MSETDYQIRCQRCGEQMEMKEPLPGEPWRPDQFWVCPRCGRHFWSTYATAPAPPQAAGAPAPPTADEPRAPKV